jgi:hypothetical protein
MDGVKVQATWNTRPKVEDTPAEYCYKGEQKGRQFLWEHADWKFPKTGLMILMLMGLQENAGLT